MTKQVSLSVNGGPITLDYFVSAFIDHTVGGMLASLRGAGGIGTLVLSIEGGEVTINLNNAQVPVNAFVNDIVRNTILGMVASLKGVSKVKSLQVTIKK